MENQLVKKETFSQYLTKDSIKSKINAIVGSEKGASFISGLLSAVQTNPALQQCTQASLLNCALLGHSLNLSPSPQLGHYYIVPYENKKLGITEGQFQLGYKAYIQMALRTGQYKTISVIDVKEGELKSFNRLTDEIELEFNENDYEREKLNTVGYVAYFKLINGFEKTLFWTREKMELHADKYSKAFNLKGLQDLKAGKVADKDMWRYSSFWYKDFDGMAFKTMLRQLISKWGIMSTEMELAFKADMSVMREDNSFDYVDNDNEDVEQIVTISKEQQEELAKIIGSNGELWAKVVDKGYNTLQEIPVDEYENIINELKGDKK